MSKFMTKNKGMLNINEYLRINFITENLRSLDNYIAGNKVFATISGDIFDSIKLNNNK